MEIARRGFSLLELVIGIALMGIVLAGMVPAVGALGVRSAEPVFEMKADLLARRVFNQIKIRDFDEHSDHRGGECRCDENLDYGGVAVCAAAPCVSAGDFGPDPGERADPRPENFNDADDFASASLCRLAALRDRCFGADGACPAGDSSCARISRAVCGDGACLLPADYFTDGSRGLSCLGGDAGDVACAAYAGFYVAVAVESRVVSGAGFPDVPVKNVRISVLSPRREVTEYQFIRGNY